MQIPIENIYYLLCYAWNALDYKNRILVDTAGIVGHLNLFAKILINASKILLKRGIDRNYLDHTEDYIGVKGKIDSGTTLKRNLLSLQKTVCTYDEFSADIITNRILVGTLYKLLRIKELDREIASQIPPLLRMFSAITVTDITLSQFKQVKLHRNNRFYRFILHICRIIHESILPSEEPGVYDFTDFTRDEPRMNQLFEAFLRNFYRLEQKRYSTVKKEIIQWQVETPNSSDRQYLPRMETDISLENSEDKIIIDAKYYTKTMAKNYDQEKIHSANLYQLFSYLLNQETDLPRTKKAAGILLYPTVDSEYDLSYSYGTHRLSIKTVNLNTEWEKIHCRLMEIIGG